MGSSSSLEHTFLPAVSALAWFETSGNKKKMRRVSQHPHTYTDTHKHTLAFPALFMATSCAFQVYSRCAAWFLSVSGQREF